MADHTDLRIVKTREAIEAAFIKLLAEKPFERITVQDILNTARVNRKTFYKHYADKYALADLLIERYLNLVSEALQNRFAVNEHGQFFPSALREFYQSMYDNRNALLALFNVRTERHLMRDDLEELLKNAYCERFADDERLNLDEQTLDYLSSSFAATVIGSVRWFLEANDERAIDVIENVAQKRNESPAFGFMGLTIP